MAGENHHPFEALDNFARSEHLPVDHRPGFITTYDRRLQGKLIKVLPQPMGHFGFIG